MRSVEAIINRQFFLWDRQQREHTEETAKTNTPLPVVTVSRQTGSRGSYFASRLAQKLNYQRLPREVIDAICSSSEYCRRIIESLDKQYCGQLDLLVESLFTGRSIDNIDYSRNLARVVLSMAGLGGVVLVGRGVNFILGPTRGFHIRFVCPRDKRIQNLMIYKQVSSDEATKMVDISDRMRKEFIRRTFDTEIDDPVQYDLTINADYIDIEELVPTAVKAIEGKMNKLAHLDNDQFD